MNKLKPLNSWATKKLSLKTVNCHPEFVGQVCPTYKATKHFAFTLAEVLITITIIGVVAAMTIPNLMTDINQRKYNSASGNFQRKLGEALRVMNGQNTLSGYSDTKDFVAELQKNMKILKVCNTVTDCFPAKIKKSDGTVIQTSTLTDATSLGQNYGTNTVGVQFADGIRAIIAYNPDYTTQNNGDVVAFDKDDKNKTVSMRTNVLSMLFDVSEDDKNKLNEDIFSKNTNFASNSGPCVQVGTYCVKDFGKDYTSLVCLEGVNQKYCGTKMSGYNTDYWAGANKRCIDEGMKLPTMTDLHKIYGYLKTDEYKNSLTLSGTYWSDAEFVATNVYYFDFLSGSESNYKGDKQNNPHGVLCINN